MGDASAASSPHTEPGTTPTTTAAAAAAAAKQPTGFLALYQKALPFPARPGLAAWSPTLDLIALVTTNENVLLYRMNGQRVWGFAHRRDRNVGPGGGETRIERLRWRPDGKMLALGYSDGSTRIYDVNNGKQIHRLTSEAASFGTVSCVGWVDNYSLRTRPGMAAEVKSADCTPQALFDMDVGQMLPRLSVLPSSAGADSTFTSKVTLDALINSVTKGGEGDNLDVLLIGEEGGKILLNVFDSFLIGTMELSSLSHQLKPHSKLLRHTASSDLSTHSLLIHEPQTNNILFATMDILFIQQFGQYLFQLASTSTRVQALLRYIQEAVVALETEFKTMNDLAQRYVSIIDEDVRKQGSEVSLEFFELLVTGVPSEVLREWLVDVLTERGQKRWEKSSMNGYETLRRLVHENLLPTCERLTVLFCRLRGLARWKERGSPLGLDPDDFTRCLDVVSGLTVFAHEFLLKLNKELEHFAAFGSWLRHTLDELSTVINIDDKPAEDPQIDTLRVSEYIRCYLKQSSLAAFFRREGFLRLSEYQKKKGESVFELYARNADREPVPPGFMELAAYLEELCRSVFAKPQMAMRQQLRVGKPVTVAEREVGKMDVRMVVEGGVQVAYVALCDVEKKANNLILIRCQISVDGSLSTVSKIGCAKVLFPDPESVLVDLHFVDSSAIILILADKTGRNSEMVSIAYDIITYDENYDHEDLSESVFSYAEALQGEEMAVVTRRQFDSSFIPVQLTINGNKGRRVGCVIAEDRMRYIVFDLDGQEEDEEEEGEEEEGGMTVEGEEGEGQGEN
ncbi:uncharacterized protein LAJ45_02244 [Morchella importuna]|uniref:uncharacterized protein n=1 Tax=Morchella importuna TaxID=1174673 RepID=UPI001E8EA93B|nr:uncharacterized protein LAJ45_02244 [Morchella importuna]KAH8153432.1 hypothetical protein LAJ45_02244 [Morchella importuna]